MPIKSQKATCFKKDIKPKNLWGGRCISRVYYGNKLNVVMFDLKGLNFTITATKMNKLLG